MKSLPRSSRYLEERGKLFIVPGTKVYQGMIIGQNAKGNDLDVNPPGQAAHQYPHNLEGRSGPADPDRAHDLEQAIAYIQDDELVEVTPQNIRIRKRELSPHDRKRASRLEVD